MLQAVGIRKNPKVKNKPSGLLADAWLQTQRESKEADAHARLKICKMRGTATPTLIELRHKKNGLEWKKELLEAAQEELDDEVADVDEAIAVKEEEELCLNFEEEEEEEEEFHLAVKEEAEEKVVEAEMCNGSCSFCYRVGRAQLICNRPCNLPLSHEPHHPCNCGFTHYIDPNTGDMEVEEMADEESAEEESAVPGMNQAEEESEGNAEQYARTWLEQNGDDSGIPKEYSPCVYFFKTKRGCQINTCQFSHNEEIFREEPFAALLQKLSWMKKTFAPPRRKKHRRADEEDL